jgi:hypothetical protein
MTRAGEGGRAPGSLTATDIELALNVCSPQRSLCASAFSRVRQEEAP